MLAAPAPTIFSRETGSKALGREQRKLAAIVVADADRPRRRVGLRAVLMPPAGTNPPPFHSHCRSTKLGNEPFQVCLCSWASFAQALANAICLRTMRARIR